MSEAPAVARPSTVTIWIRAIRPFAFTASVMPVVVGAMLALGSPGAAWGLLPLIAIGAVLFHTGTNLVSDAADYDRGVDRPGTHGGSGVLVEGILTSRQVFLGGLLAFAVGSAIGLILVYVRGPGVLWLGLAGLIGGFFYGGKKFGYKYIALGDAMVFALMGPLIVIGTYFVLTGRFEWVSLYVSLPVGCLVTAILHANNTRDIADDRQGGARTMANVFGLTAAKVEYSLLVGGAYVIVVALVIAGIAGPWCLLALLSAPLAGRNIVRIIQAKPERSERIASLDVETATLHLLFCVLLSAGLLVSALT
ncbi:MAG: 1,4-dihydroxy-2-naphthoate octaprenyltransferase [Planctomycetota bacterium]|jgi:1,4-dihydroxy-2-naphthoate octaprenyltransferase